MIYSTVCRDIGGSDPERMAAPRVCDYVQEIFKNTCIKVALVFVGGYVCIKTSFHCYGCEFCLSVVVA